ncbi:hypothetical protein, variant [Verruconis gallopava]|uniref:Heterokaryon incompatibility Het-C n=1 Tax=Verruconis gallopava TaxID=253628 RepID=A0A0D1YKA1_9PEZI|nr:hypothetical protein, variant [Verruconis gallopava]KIW01302.1 hypothetical protein, variant [Verruconis gallopava]
MAALKSSILLLLLAVVLLYSTPAYAFGAGNIASLSKIEGKNWRHGDIEDMLKTVAFIRGHKWTSMMIKRVYFGNWLRDYSQAVDVGTLKGVQAGTIRILVWILGFMSFGYATQEFEVTEERLGVYRPEEHIDNPKDYADNEDARKYDPRLRPPVQDVELQIDMNTGMKNYIANETGGWATSSGYVKHSLARSIHFGRMYTSSSTKGRTEDLCEALRCLGQALHTMEDFGAHSNYTELALIEMGYHNVFPHVGTATRVNVRGKYVWPVVTGTFGGVDFLHSVIGEATDHVTQSELDEMDDALGLAAGSGSGTKGSGGSANQLGLLGDLLSKVPGTSHLMEEAHRLQAASNAQAQANASGYRGVVDDSYSYSASRADPPMQTPSFQAPPGSIGGPPGPGIPGLDPNMDPQAVVAKIYPILVFRDNVVRTISGIISKIPGLEKLIDTITERVTLFIFSLLAPYLKPIIAAASKQLKNGSTAVVDSSGKHQYEVWENPHSSDPTHSLLSKDHFSNYLNPPAGQVATAILQYTAPRVFYAWDHPDVPVEQVLNDVVRAFHHPALRDPNLEIHRNMFQAVEHWVRELPDHGNSINDILSSDSVKAGRNHKGEIHAHGSSSHGGAHSHGGGFSTLPGMPSGIPSIPGFGSHSKVSGSPFEMFNRKRALGEFDDVAPSGAAATQEWQPQGGPPLQQQKMHSPQPAASPWQPGGYENQSFAQMQQAPQNLDYDHGAYEMPTNYHQGYHDGPGYGGPPPAPAAAHNAPSPYGEAGGSSGYGYVGGHYQQAGGPGYQEGYYSQPPPGPYGQY